VASRRGLPLPACGERVGVRGSRPHQLEVMRRRGIHASTHSCDPVSWLPASAGMTFMATRHRLNRRHPRAGGDPGRQQTRAPDTVKLRPGCGRPHLLEPHPCCTVDWVPACAGMTPGTARRAIIWRHPGGGRDPCTCSVRWVLSQEGRARRRRE
jgi:hypothetical protein